MSWLNGERRSQARGTRNRRHRPVRLQLRRSDHRLDPGGRLDPGSHQGVAQRRIGAGIGHDGNLRTQRDRLLRKQGRIPAGNKCTHLKAVRICRKKLDRLGANTSRAAEDRNRTHCVRSADGRITGVHSQRTTPRPRISTSRAAVGAAVNTASNRSRSPPWPGIKCPESLTPKWRFS